MISNKCFRSVNGRKSHKFRQLLTLIPVQNRTDEAIICEIYILSQNLSFVPVVKTTKLKIYLRVVDKGLRNFISWADVKYSTLLLYTGGIDIL